MSAKKNIIVNLQVEGTHNWPGCAFDEVAFLSDPHRHVFHITVKKEVFHDNRDIEIIMFKREIEAWIKDRYGMYGNFQNKSCEMLAEEILEQFEARYVSVLEDGENGAEAFKYWKP